MSGPDEARHEETEKNTDKTPRTTPGTEEAGQRREQLPITTLAEAQAQAVAAAKTKAARPSAGSQPAVSHRIIPLAEADAFQEALYARRQRVYPREVHGILANWRAAMVFVTLGLYYLLPWIEWGANRQAFLIDLPNRKFNLFFWTFWPQDLFYLTAILILSALSLFLFTAVAGRVWCGFTCPQTVWTEVFLWIERKIEGDRPKQMKLAAGPWNRAKITKRTGKHAVWLLFSAWTGFTFVGYFTPIRELGMSLAQFALGPWETFWILFYGFATYGNAGWLREQVCLYMCPYARFQGAMFDKDTLIISYDPARGEPRAARKKSEDHKGKGLGDCVDCTLCVQVCPTGIDIRDGLQVGCIACGACVDVCNTVMDKMGYSRGLIRYTSENALEGRPWKLLRPRVLVYAGLLGAIAVALVVAVLARVPLQVDVLRDRNTLFRDTSEGLIENVYTLRGMNMDSQPHTYAVTATGIDGLALQVDGRTIQAAPGEVVDVPVRLQAAPENVRGRSNEVTFILTAQDNPKIRAEEPTRFLGPAASGR